LFVFEKFVAKFSVRMLNFSINSLQAQKRGARVKRVQETHFVGVNVLN